MLGEEKMMSSQATFGEDMQSIWVSETPPAGTYNHSWHTQPETVVYGGHVGIQGESVNPGWGPYEHLLPSSWKSTLGESYRRCCTSVSWVGEALAARLIPGVQEAWNHPQFFAYADRWMFSPDDPRDLEAIHSATGMTIDPDFMQGQSWKILSGGGYYEPHRTFVDEMWNAYRNGFPDTTPPSAPTGLMATVASSSRIDLSWTASTDDIAVAGYRIYRNGKLINTSPGTSYQSGGLRPFTTYTYRVTAFDTTMNTSPKSEAVTKTTQPRPSTKFSVGDRIQVTEKLTVRSTPSTSGASLGIHSRGETGTVTGGPWYAGGRWWWQVNFDSDPDGWAVQRKLTIEPQP